MKVCVCVSERLKLKKQFNPKSFSVSSHADGQLGEVSQLRKQPCDAVLLWSSQKRFVNYET